MKYSLELQKTIDDLNLKKENILYLNIENQYLDEMRAGTKNVEYRVPSQFYISRLYYKGAKSDYRQPKPLTHLLFQGGYNPDSPRVFMELKGWVDDETKVPEDIDTTGHVISFGLINLVLGEIIYDSTWRPDRFSKPLMFDV